MSVAFAIIYTVLSWFQLLRLFVALGCKWQGTVIDCMQRP